MKKKYLSPEVELTLLTVDDILTASLDDEIEIDGEDLFN